jgi:hypothetical protein
MATGSEAESPVTLSLASISRDDARTVGTVDYDYAAAFRGGGDRLLSDVPRRPRVDAQTKTTATPAGSGDTIFSDEPTLDEDVREVLLDVRRPRRRDRATQYSLTTRPSTRRTRTREVPLDVYAPAGKFGVIIDTPGDGASMIHFIKEGSPMADKSVLATCSWRWMTTTFLPRGR